LPDAAQTKPNEGEVIAVGPGFTTKDGVLVPVNVKVGDKVLLPEYGGSLVKVGDEEAYIFRGDEILAKYT
jgi:chaperonin GroES